jgi:hypothetical protein
MALLLGLSPARLRSAASRTTCCHSPHVIAGRMGAPERLGRARAPSFRLSRQPFTSVAASAVQQIVQQSKPSSGWIALPEPDRLAYGLRLENPYGLMVGLRPRIPFPSALPPSGRRQEQ